MSEPDWALQALVGAIDHTRTYNSITVTVNGTVITGVLISAEEYAANVAQQMRKAHNIESKDIKGIDALFDRIVEDAREKREQHEAAVEADDESLSSGPPHFLHLREAIPVTGSEVPQGEGGWWRIRISDVSGWTLGQISTLR
ncbi:hypothetical protein [Streptosporangium roseum]|uniref:hypothetical protein n=1 Tax=Streptosporangium roseum TaxID=2001 RepID=UPI0004CD61BF|nr:hypothetical protein [Streptosporangium roseum]